MNCSNKGQKFVLDLEELITILRHVKKLFYFIMTNRGNSDLAQQLLSLLQTYQATSSYAHSQMPAASASAIARSLRDDNVLAENVGHVLGSSSSASQQNRPLLPSLHRPSSYGRFVPYGRRKKREPKSYNMKLVIIDFIREVDETCQTKHFDGNTLMESLFHVRENELHPPIRARILSIIKFRFQLFDGTFFYASRQGRTIINLSPCQTLDGKAVYTLKSKATNNLYVMLSKKAPGNRPTDNCDEEELEVVHHDDVSVLQCIDKPFSSFRSFFLFDL